MAAQSMPRIVLLKEKANAEEFAASLAKSSDDAVPAAMAMEAAVEPGDTKVQFDQDGEFVVGSLTDADVKRVKEKPEVAEVVDDIDVYALGAADPGEPLPPDQDVGDQGYDFDQQELLLDEEDKEALAADPFPEWDGSEDLITPEMAIASSQIEPAGVEQAASIEQQLAGELPEGLGHQVQGLPIPKDKILCIVKAVLACLLKGSPDASDISTERIETFLRDMGVED